MRTVTFFNVLHVLISGHASKAFGVVAVVLAAKRIKV